MKLHLIPTLTSTCAILALACGPSMAGGFNVRSQSAVGNGMAHAGAGTSGWGPSSMFWNPAAITDVPGIQTEANLSYVIPYASAELSVSPMLLDPRFNQANSGDINLDSLVPAGYGTWQINDRLWIGLAAGAPFGSRSQPDENFSGSLYNAGSQVEAYAATPTVGVKVTDWLSIGAGVTVQYLDVSLKSQLRGGLGSETVADLAGDAFGVGFTAGVNITPWQGGSIGLGFRSAIKHNLEGSFQAGSLITAFGLAPSTDQGIKTTITLPESLTLGIRQDINEQWTVLGTAQWTNWSRLGRSAITSTGGVGLPAPTEIGFDYRDEWMFSLGAEYRYNDKLTLRAGAAYEISPVTDKNRGLRVLDNDRFWLSAGLGYKINERFSADISYSHLFIKDGEINITAGHPNFQPAPAFGDMIGLSKGSANVISVAMRYRWDAPATDEAIIRKY